MPNALFVNWSDALPRTDEPLPPGAAYCCAQCGYDRSGAPASEHCPECGAPATSSRWIVRGQKLHSPLLPAAIGAVAMLLTFQHLFSIPPELFVPLQAVTLIIMIQMLRRPYRAILCAAPEGLTLRWGFGPAILMPASSIRTIRFLIAPGLNLQRTGPARPTRWMLEIVPVPGANLRAGPVRASADDLSDAAAPLRHSLPARIAGLFRPWGIPPALIVKGSREDIRALEKAISTTLDRDESRQDAANG